MMLTGAMYDIAEECKDMQAKRQLLEVLYWLEKILNKK